MNNARLDSVQQDISRAILARHPNAIVKKIDRDNYLDIHIPAIHPGPPMRDGSTHICFSILRSGISISWVCRDTDAVSWILERSASFEQYSHGLRPVGNPKFENASSAVDAAVAFISEIERSAAPEAPMVNASQEEDEDEIVEDEFLPVAGDMLIDFLRVSGVWPRERDPWSWGDDTKPLPDGIKEQIEKATAALIEHIRTSPNWFEIPSTTEMRVGLNDPMCGEMFADEFSDLVGTEEYPWNKRGPLWYSSRLSINGQLFGPVLFLRDCWVAVDPDDPDQFTLLSWDDFLQYTWPAISRDGSRLEEVLLLGEPGNPRPKIVLQHPTGCPWTALSLGVAAAVLSRVLPVAAESVQSNSFSHPPITPWSPELLQEIFEAHGVQTANDVLEGSSSPNGNLGELDAIKPRTSLPDGTSPYTLSFRAWVGEIFDEDAPVEYFVREYATLNDAKAAFRYSVFEWDEGEWAGDVIRISFRWPPLIEFAGKVVARCEMTDYEDDLFEWVDA